MVWLFTNIAKALDTLPAEGRVMLLGLLLTIALCGFAMLLRGAAPALRLLYGKGALVALLAVPLLVYLLGIQVPVPVEHLERFATPVPAYVTWALLSIWLTGLLWQVSRLVLSSLRTRRAVGALAEGGAKLNERAAHWSRRLNLGKSVLVRAEGSQAPWHVGADRWRRQPAQIVLPAAAQHWPTGVVDVMLLQQLALVQQSAWRWLWFARFVSAVFWPAPWLARMVERFAHELTLPSLALAGAAYRDPDGWRRDLRQLRSRAETLEPVAMELLRVPNDGAYLEPAGEPLDTEREAQEFADFEGAWARTKRRWTVRHRDPYEQAYWLIAVASIVVCVATTLTLKQAAPEFEPRFLNIKWQDQMVRRAGVYEDVPRDREPPRTLQNSADDAATD